VWHIKYTASFVSAILLSALASQSYSFQLTPGGTAKERQLAANNGVKYKVSIPIFYGAMHKFGDPTHEALTQKIYGCDGDWDKCANPDLEDAGAYILAGVRWNDDLVFMPGEEEISKFDCIYQNTVGFITQTGCWLRIFRSAEEKSAKNPQAFMGVGNYLSRSHFGDLQFLHSMAAQDGESAQHTKDKILMWAEFAWGVADGTYPINTYLRNVHINGWNEHFNNRDAVQDLYTIGRPWLRPHIKEVAFGSLLHVIEDSFSYAHVERRNALDGEKCVDGKYAVAGRIIEFHSYSRQDHKKHKSSDTNIAAKSMLETEKVDVVDVGKKLREFLADGKKWGDVKPYFDECVFALDGEPRAASPGVGYKIY